MTVAVFLQGLPPALTEESHPVQLRQAAELGRQAGRGSLAVSTRLLTVASNHPHQPGQSTGSQPPSLAAKDRPNKLVRGQGYLL